MQVRSKPRVLRDLRSLAGLRSGQQAHQSCFGIEGGHRWAARGMSQVVKGFGRRPFATVGLGPGPALESLPRSEDRGRLGSETSAIGDAGCFQRKGRWLGFSMATMRGSEAFASVEGRLVTSRGRRARVPALGWRRRRSTVRGGVRGDGHELSILIRLGDGERQGRGPSNVSTMIIRPPQQGQRRAGETSSARLSASREGWGAFSAAAISCRARSMLSARTAPANRP
jgi:hypothetical protein